MPKPLPLDPAQCSALVASSRWANKVRADDSGCIMWIGAIVPEGYGRVSLGGKLRYAHRVAYVADTGMDIPEGLDIDHLCRCRACVNPAHLEAVTRVVNVVRGVSQVATNAAKDQCPEGHALTADNLVEWHLFNKGSRSCKKCAARHSKEKSALVSAAAQSTGLSWRAYIAEYGHGKHRAESVLIGHGVDPADILRALDGA